MGRMRRFVTMGVPVGGGVYTPPYDGITLAAAYALRQLYTDYDGDAVLLRRDSDNAEKAFGFASDGGVNVAAITSWLAGATAYVKTWYDQSGNDRHASQATTSAQPALTLNAQNGRALLTLSGTEQMQTGTFALFSGAAFTLNAIFGRTNLARIIERDRFIITGKSSNRVRVAISDGITTDDLVQNAEAYPTDGTRYIATLVLQAGTLYSYNNGVAKGTDTTAVIFADNESQLTLFASSIGSLQLTGTFGEMLIADGVLSDSDQNAIGQSLAKYYGLSWENFT